jgi:polysaccharide biosynthesis protein PelF
MIGGGRGHGERIGRARRSRDVEATDGVGQLTWVHEPSKNGHRAAASRELEPPMRVLLTTEGTYPFHWGGLATWCHALIQELPDVEFSLLAVCKDPLVTPLFDRPANLVDFRALPLWGIRNAWEIDQNAGRRAFRRRWRTNEDAIERHFLPAYLTFVGQLLGDERNDHALAASLHQLYRYSQDHDFDATFRSELVWDAFSTLAMYRFPRIADELGYDGSPPTFSELLWGAQWIYHWLFPLSQPLEKVDIAHATMGGICSMLAVVCQREHGAGFLMSEHGIYLRECYLAEAESDASLFGKVLKLAFAKRLTELAYTHADAIAPCCDYNQRWERRIGVDQERIHTAYYGIDSDRFEPSLSWPTERPVVVWAGRIDPLKDVETLLRAAAVVRREIPDVCFLLYGAAPPGNELYEERCLALHAQLGLEGTVSFEGFTSNVLDAFTHADLVVLSSISEGFPYSTLEAMLCGKPIVATAVGGISEQVTPDCGRVVRPRDPEALGAAIVDVLGDMETCVALSLAARDRAVSLFGIETFRATHRSIYDVVLRARRPFESPAQAVAPARPPASAVARLEELAAS